MKKRHIKWFDYSPSDRLDDLLYWLVAPPKTYNGGADIDSIAKFVFVDNTTTKKISKDEAISALELLISDGLVKEKLETNQMLPNNPTTIYGITYKGLLFQQAGGYKSDLRRKKLAEVRAFVYALSSGTIGVILGAFLTWYLTPSQLPPVKTDSPKFYILHDTIYREVPKKDTVLVRIVKMKKPL